MRKVFLSIYDCKPGIVMAETIFNEYGAVVVAENAVLDENLVNKLKSLGITKVKVFEDFNNIIEADKNEVPKAEVFKAMYADNIKTIKEVLHDISTGKNIRIEKVNSVSDSIIDKFNENRYIVSCLNQVKAVDEYTYTHCINVSMISMLIGKWMNIGGRNLKLLVQAGLLHDIGKSRISAEIINKPGPLSTKEFEEMKKHPVYGYQILEEVEHISREVSLGVLMHHERDDGSGYPFSIKGRQIHQFAKIIAIADIYDAMTSDRVYRYRESPFEVFNLMENNTFGILDTVVVNTFLNNIANYYIGDRVRLNTGELAEIIHINPRHISQPIIRVNREYVDLTTQRNIKILELM